VSLGIHRYDHPLRFWVPSQTRHGLLHLVDLTSFRNNGQCTCEHFLYRCQPELTRGAVPSTLLRCNHIEQARDYFINEMLTRIAKHAPPDQEPMTLEVKSDSEKSVDNAVAQHGKA
jgi:hypothetical protein